MGDGWGPVGLSLWVAFWAVLCSLPPAVAIGYWLARGRSSARWAVETVVNLPLVLPPVVTGYLLLVLLGRRSPVGRFFEEVLDFRFVFTWQGAALAAAVVGFPLMVRAIRLGFQGVDPRLEKAARSLGAGRVAAFFTVSLPLAARGIVAGSILAFARGLGEFGATIVLAGNIPGETRTIPLAVFSAIQVPGGEAAAARLVAVSVLLAAAALIVGEWLEYRQRRREAA